MPGSEYDIYPKGWTPFNEFAAAAVYGCSPLLAIVLEAPAGYAVRVRLGELLGDMRRIAVLQSGWGFPDFAAAREMLGVSVDDASARLGITDEEFVALELCWSPPSLDGLLGIVELLQWPLGALFRNGDELHPITWLSRSLAARLKA